MTSPDRLHSLATSRASASVADVIRRGLVRSPRRLRTRVRNAIGIGVATALLLFGIPLAAVLDRLINDEALTSLQRDATRAIAAVPDNVLQVGQILRVPQRTGAIRVAAYDARGRRVAGSGPERSRLAAQAADGHEHDGRDGSDVAVVLPVRSDTAVAGSVRAALPRDVVRARVERAWALLAALGLLVIVISRLLARRAAERVSEPFEEITRAARQLGAGRFEVDLPVWGITEADAAGEALRDSAREIDDLVAHERAFVRDASHQLRTPLAALLVQLEQRPPDVAGAVASAHHLDRTVADLLAVRAVRSREVCDPALVVAEVVRRRHTAAAPVVLRLDHVGLVGIGEPALRQALDVLIDNGLRHGVAPVIVTVESYGETVAVEVSDQGQGFAEAAVAGTGLSLATRLAERAGGALLVRSSAARPRVALLLPPAASS